jgi:exodeoxyribonuclease V alpha subunit
VTDVTGAAREVLVGTVERTRYQDPRTRYTVLSVHVRGQPLLVPVVGRADVVEDGAEVELHGRWGAHPKHGRQFEFDALLVRPPTAPVAIARRLTLYPGIGEAMAERIVGRFGADTLRILDEQPRRLLEVDGIGEKTLDRVQAFHRTRTGALAALEHALVELELPPRLANLLHDRYGDLAPRLLREQPYRLAREVRGVGFLTADRIARAVGIALDSEARIDAGLAYALERAASDGHVALPRGRWVTDTAALLGLPESLVDAGVARLEADGDVVLELARGVIDAAVRRGEATPDAPSAADEQLAFPRELLLAEMHVDAALVGLALAPREAWEPVDLPAELAERQIEAVHAIASHGVTVLTGGPGTGKSTVVRSILALAKHNETAVLLAAPTGRAAKRLEQATGQSASTIHRLLDIQPDSGQFAFNANQPLPPGLLVVDEASMLDLPLSEALLTSLTPEHRLLLVGDADQLPSVGPGNVLRDVIAAASGRDSPIPVIRLDRVFRQAEGSSIVENAHRVLHGERPRSDDAGQEGGGEFFVVRATDADRAHELVVRMVTERIPEAYGLDPKSDVQVLCPMHKGRAGTESLNRALQHKLAGDAPGVTVTGGSGAMPPRVFRLGDRVMQTKNDYERGIFNGDIGTVARVDVKERRVVIDFDGTIVSFEANETGPIQLAYAISIHKSQGSEFPAVVIPLLGEHHVMLRRNLLYTAITRARRLCVLVGDPRAIDRAVRTSDAARRFTGLEARMRRTIAEVTGGTHVDYDTGAAIGAETGEETGEG